jgi:ADP-ribose pyrophosphatase
VIVWPILIDLARDWEFCSRQTRAPGSEIDGEWSSLEVRIRTNKQIEGKEGWKELSRGVWAYDGPRTWAFVIKRENTSFADQGVGIIAILERPSGKEILLQKQYRPPVNGVCIEVPAGLLDLNESIEKCAERELLEETGYIGKAVRVSPPMFNDPGFCNTNLKLVHMSIDLDDPRNQNPKPQLEDGEFIETFTVPLKDLPERLEQLSNEGFILDARIQNIADGIEIAKRHLL